jgi:hypothetical protein
MNADEIYGAVLAAALAAWWVAIAIAMWKDR